MGACCSGKESKKGDSQEEEIYTKSSRMDSFDENGLGMKAIFDLEVENSSLSKNLCSIIIKIMNEEGIRKDINLSKITLEYLWNIYRYYLEDHSESNFLIYDYRENSLKDENFLKKFKSINYKIEQMNNFSNNQFQRFKKYVKDKNIIIIAKDDSIIAIEEFIYFILENKINSKIFLFDYNLATKNSLSILNRNLIEVIDYPNFCNLPFIFLSLRFFKHMKNDSIIFLEFKKIDKKNKNNKDNKDNKDYKDNKDNLHNFNYNLNSNFNLFDKKFSDEDFFEQNILNFFRFFNIGLNLRLNVKSEENNNFNNNNDINKINISNNNNNNSKKEIPSNYSNNFDNIYSKNVKDVKNNYNNNNNFDGNNSSYDYKIKFFELNSITNLEEFYLKSEALLEFIDKIKYEIKQNKSMVIQIPFDIDKDFLISLLFLLVWKITSIDPINLLGYLKETIFYIPGIKNLSAEQLDKLLINLETVYKMPNKIDNNFLVKSSQSFYNTNKSKKVIDIKLYFLNIND
jgi:hypothetical protein